MDSSLFDFEALQPSMLRMIRSARSRLHRDNGPEDGETSRVRTATLKSVTDSALAASVAARRGSDLKSSRSHRLSVGSENAAPEKSQGLSAPTAVLGDATNTYAGAGLGQRPPMLPDAACPAPMAKASQMRLTHANGKSFEDQEDKEIVAAQRGNPQHVEEYAQDIFQVLKRNESLQLPSPIYMEQQVHVSSRMRSILVDWLVDVHKKYKLGSETLFLAVQLIDRYLEVEVVAQRHLQLVGVTALFIAAKFEEIHPPQIKEFVFVTDKAYSKEDIMKMEVCMLKAFEFKICSPTSMHFLDRYQSVNACTEMHRDLAHYLLQLTLVDYKMLKYAPSHLTAASILLSNKLLRRPAWPPAVAKHTQLTEAMLKECAKEMCNLLENAETSSLQAVRRKFSQLKYHSVAKLNFTLGPDHVPAATTGRRSIGGAVAPNTAI